MSVSKDYSISPGWAAVIGLGGIVAGAIINGVFNHLDHKADLDAKMIELSVGILRTEPTPTTKPLREWAINVIQSTGSFNFNEEQRATLLKEELPFKGPTFAVTPTTSAYTIGVSPIGVAPIGGAPPQSSGK